jgi:4a-hydroxytetrahydrobiopterin dehydratase
MSRREGYVVTRIGVQEARIPGMIADADNECRENRRYVVATRLSDVEVVRALTDLQDWHGDCASISRVVVIDEDDIEGLLVDLEKVAREMDHDPDVEREEGELTITMSTHSKGGVTDLDVEYARRVDELVARRAA